MVSIPLARPHRSPFAAAIVLLASLLVAPGASAQLGGRAVVSGTVRSVEGGPVAGARVTVLPEEGREERAVAASTDEEGRFELEVRRGLPGTFRVRVEADGYETLDGRAELARGRETTIDVDLLRSEQVARQRATAAYNQGVAAIERGDMEAAERHFAEAAEADPELPDARLGLAEVSLRRDRPREAAEHVEAYLALRPDDTHAHRLAYEAYSALGDEEGMAREKAVLAETGAGSEVAGEAYNRGVTAFQAGDLEEALARFREALELDPDLAAAATAIAAIHYQEGRHQEAAREAAALLERDPESVEALRLRFLALEAAGTPEADAALAAYAEVDPDAAVELLSGWAEDHFEADRRESARKQLLRLLAIRPDHAEAHYRLGLVYAGSGEPEQAEEHLRRFLELAPGHPEADAARAILEGL